jgi:EAL domain-containing protein (putative c-di-GMP-specific phosphodiesterase class I)
VDTKTGEIIGFEALLRLRDHNISPGIFIPIAEETGHIIQIGRWVAEEAIMQLDRWRRKGFTKKVVSINYSSKQLRDRNYIRFLEHLLREYEICPEYVEVEITESFFLENDSQTKEFLRELKEIGFKLALDDFGTGFSSLNYLTFMPVDKIKLDKSINDKFLQSENTEVIDSIISLAHSLKLKITAEGIEEMDKYLLLKNGGCDYIQGYLFSKPLPADEIEQIYNSNLLERLEYNKYNLL